MKHQTVEAMQAVAEVHEGFPIHLTRAERLARWAECLERHPGKLLNTLYQTEYHTNSVRDEMRGDNTPISVAFHDPVLRAAGMKNDTFGEAKRFFELKDGDLHDVVCFCHFGETVRAEAAARNVRITFAGKVARVLAKFVGIFRGH
jgi:hypothetical protein